MEVKRQMIGSYDNREFPVLIIRSKHIGKDVPALIYYHGGVFFLEASSAHKKSAFLYAQQSKCAVIFPLFRLSIQNKFPTTIEDSYATLIWTAQHARQIGIDPNRIAIGGDSSGGSITAVVSQMALDRKEVNICFQMLIYAAFDHTMSFKSMKKYTDAPFSNTKTFEVMWSEYLDGIEIIPDYVSALQRVDLRNLPPAYIETAEFDPTHDEGVWYAHKLQEAGVNVELNETKGTIHAYDVVNNSPITIENWNKRINALRKSFNN